MRKLVGWLLLTLLIVQAAPAKGAAESLHAARPLSPSLLNSLRQGGYVLYVRHGEATVGEDRPDLNVNDCSTQRNLSALGQDQARRFGEALRRLRIPVQKPVLASPLCRTRQSAALAFGAENVQADLFWQRVNALGNASQAERTEILAGVRAELEKIPLPGTNRVVVAHGFPRGVGLGEIPYMGAVVVKPGGPGNGYEVVDRLSLEDWTTAS